jgi:MEDS: MEthanogen/methylotroph, DcmR Sensory domain
VITLYTSQRQQRKMTDRTNLSLTRDALRHLRHVCAFFRNLDEEMAVLLPFARASLERGERVIFIVGRARRDEYLRRLDGERTDVATELRSGRIEVLSWEESGDRRLFTMEVMLRLVPGLIEEGRSRGYPLTSVIANMEWALEILPGGYDLVEFEARLEAALRPYDDPVICVYDSSRFGGRVVLDVLRIHPAAIIGGLLQENPFYVPPEDYLKELRGRQA